MSTDPSGLRAVILAAGLGTRMKSRTPKVLHEICGRPMLAYVMDAAWDATGEAPLVVYSPQTAQICEVFANQANFALQEEPRGTGDALRAALAALPSDATEIVVLSGDAPLVQPETVRALAELRRKHDAGLAVAAMQVDDPTGYGRLVVKKGKVTRIVEEKDATDKQRAIDLVNAGLYAFDVAWLRGAITRLKPSKVTGELYLTDLVELAHDDQRDAVVPDDHDLEWQLAGINDRADLADAEAAIQADRSSATCSPA